MVHGIRKVMCIRIAGKRRKAARRITRKTAIWLSLFGGFVCHSSPVRANYPEYNKGAKVGTTQGGIYKATVITGMSGFGIPFKKLTMGNCFRLVSRDAHRWTWNGSREYMGVLTTGNMSGGVLTGIPLPDGIEAGEYDFDVMIGMNYGGVICYSKPVPLLVKVLDKSDSREEVICSGEHFQYTPDCLKIGEGVAANFHWVREAVPGIQQERATGTGEIDEVLVNNTQQVVKVTYVYTVEGDKCNGNEGFEVTVTINPAVKFEVYNRKVELCEGEMTDIEISTQTENVRFVWKAEMFGVSGEIEGEGNTIRQPLRYEGAPGTALYHISAFMGETACALDQKIAVRVKPLPEIALEWTDPMGDVTLGTPLQIQAYPQGFDNYLFRFNEQVMEREINELLVYDWREHRENKVSVTVINKDGCLNSDSLILTGPGLKLPNVITPDGDGVNDRLFAGLYLEVFNRNGSLVYAGEDGWDGRYSGKMVPSGTYLYVVQYKTPEGRKLIRKYHVYVRTGN